ncbi:GSCFA domain-containing protein [Corynebacterium casei]|uniref:GSCFA domain-containing protein n=1 Tax=Corynebacterium casei TaxID=160386 RepID=UPI003FD37CE0
MPEKHPYKGLPDRSFWKRAVATRHYEDMTELWTPPAMEGSEKFATAGSCFAQHLGRHIARRGQGNYLDFETAPLSLPAAEHGRFGYGIYSCRYGNIYTTRQLLQIAQEALNLRSVSEHVLEKDNRFYDAVRPSVDPVGLESREDVIELRKVHLSKVREMLESLDVMIFTLGLTESWMSTVDGTVFPNAPGVVAGSMSSNPAKFHNLSVSESLSDMKEFWNLLREINPTARMILTVSPVPLIATASGNHVLQATIYSKSVLRVVAQEMADSNEDIYYFPSYEIINSAQGGGYYFDPDKRGVNDRGVQYVMSHFFTGDMGKVFPEPGEKPQQTDVVCDEEAIQARVDQDSK